MSAVVWPLTAIVVALAPIAWEVAHRRLKREHNQQGRP